MRIIPNLHFAGYCEQAIELYENAFRTERTVFLRCSDANPEDSAKEPNDMAGHYIYHAEVRIGGQRIILNDALGDLPTGANVSILVSCDSAEQVQETFEILREGAQILRPLTQTSYSEAFVSLVDRFGVRWELMKEA